MLFYLQLFLIILFFSDDGRSQVLIYIADFFVLLFYLIIYLSNFSYFKVISNNNISFPRFSMKNYEILGKKETLFVKFKVFHNDVYNDLKQKFFPRMIVHNTRDKLELYCNTLEIIFIDDFTDMSKSYVKNLIIDNNKLEEIPDILLPNNLRSLSAKRCGLLTLNLSIDSLVELDLSNNSLSNLSLSCGNLLRLYLQNNLLNDLKLNTPKLRVLNVEDNLLENLDVSGMDLIALNIKNNQFVVLPSNFFGVRRLHLLGNPIIPNLNVYRWCEYFDIFYPHFFRNNTEIRYNNIYEDQELVHNSYVNNCIGKCIEELLGISRLNKVPNYNIFDVYLKGIKNQEVCQDFTLKDLVNTIIFISKKKNLWETVYPIMIYELEDGKNYCFSGKVGRIISSIMGFNLINNVITLSKKDEIMTKYELVTRRLRNFEGRSDYYENLRKEFRIEMEMMGVEKEEIDEWVNAIE